MNILFFIVSFLLTLVAKGFDPSIYGQEISSNAFTATVGSFEISRPGYYFLTGDLVGTSEQTAKSLVLISTDNVILDLRTRSISCLNADNVAAAIKIADGVSNITIKNGVIRDVSSTIEAAGYGILVNSGANSTVSHIVVEDLTILGCGQFGVSVSNCNDLIMNNVRCTGNGPEYDAATAGTAASFAGGAYLKNVNSLSIKNSIFSGNGWQALAGGYTPSSQISIVGLYLDTCSYITMDNCFADNNSNASTSSTAIFAAGIYAVNCGGGKFINVNASGNTMPSTASVNGTTYGMYFKGTATPFCSGNTFCECAASNNVGITNCYGFAIDSPSSGGSSGNRFIDCIANFNNCSQTTIANAATVHGFHCLYTASNSFINCTADTNFVNGTSSTASTAVRTAAGFYSAGSYSNQFIKCQANRNNVSSETAKTATYPFGSGATFSFAAGFQLGDQAMPAIETATIIRDCSANNNAALGATSTTSRAFGVVILPIPATPSATNISVQNTIEDTETFSNSTTSTTSGYYAYGIVDLTPGNAANSAGLTTPSNVGSTTFLRYNVSFGQGATFNVLQTSIRSFGSNNMNYFIDYAAGFTGANALNVIYETILGALDASNSDASLYGYKIYNLSLRQNVTS